MSLYLKKAQTPAYFEVEYEYYLFNNADYDDERGEELVKIPIPVKDLDRTGLYSLINMLNKGQMVKWTYLSKHLTDKGIENLNGVVRATRISYFADGQEYNIAEDINETDLILEY